MRGAFVVQLGPDTDPSQDRFEGQVEEVDSGKELRFRSGKELLDFLGLRFNAALRSEDQLRAEEAPDYSSTTKSFGRLVTAEVGRTLGCG
jgi:hypothetical protein